MGYFVGGFAEVLNVNSLPMLSVSLLQDNGVPRGKGERREHRNWDIFHPLELRTLKKTFSLLETKREQDHGYLY